MRTEANKSWWQQLGAISQGMLFLDGHIASAEAVHAFHLDGNAVPRVANPERHERARRALQARRVRQMTALSLFR